MNTHHFLFFFFYHPFRLLSSGITEVEIMICDLQFKEQVFCRDAAKTTEGPKE
jgi:hypothetical protein